MAGANVIIKMVYKIRNKGFENFTAATTPRVYLAKKVKTQFPMDMQVTLQVHITRFTGMRILHNYRNISRATKQFMMGDRILEQLMILQLREHYFRPMRYEAPIENSFFMVTTPNPPHSPTVYRAALSPT